MLLGWLFIGTSGVDQEHFEGDIDNLRIYHRALSEAVVSLICSTEKDALGAEE